MTNLEIERKYIIKMPDIALLSSQKNYTVSHIEQIYIKGNPGETRRVRRRVYSDKELYFETVKIRVDDMSSTEIEREITAEEYNLLAESILEGTKPIIKTRHTFDCLGQTFEIDVYPQWQSTAITETELESRETTVNFPDFIEIIREVTGDKAYSNAAMSRVFPMEE